MKKKVISLLLASCMVFSLAACGNNGAKETEAPATDAATDAAETEAPADETEAPAEDAADGEAVELKLWTYPVGQWGDSAAVESLIADFNAQYPNVSVKVELLDYTNGDDQVNTAIEGGQAPDLIFEGPERLVANWGAKGYMVDMADLWAEDYTAGIYDSIEAACKNADGAYYEFPVCMTAHCMAINYDLFKEADALQYIDEETHTWTTENFVKAVEAVVAYGHENVGAVYCSGQGGDQGTRALVNNLYGGTFTNPEHTAYTADSEENVKALELLNGMEGINFDASIAGGDEITLFCNGTLAMAFCWNVAQEITHTVTTPDVDFEIFPMAFPSESEPKLQGGIWGFGIFDNGDAAKIEAAKNFVRFMTEDDAQYTKSVTTSTYWPVRDVAGIYDGDEIMTEYGTFMQYMGDYYQVTPGWAEARTAWWNMLQQIGQGADVKTAVDEFVSTANTAAGN